MLTKGYSHLDGSLQWYGNYCDDIDDVDVGDNDDAYENNDVDADGDDAGDNNHDAYDYNFFGNKQ